MSLRRKWKGYILQSFIASLLPHFSSLLRRVVVMHTSPYRSPLTIYIAILVLMHIYIYTYTTIYSSYTYFNVRAYARPYRNRLDYKISCLVSARMIYARRPRAPPPYPIYHDCRVAALSCYRAYVRIFLQNIRDKGGSAVGSASDIASSPIDNADNNIYRIPAI